MPSKVAAHQPFQLCTFEPQVFLDVHLDVTVGKCLCLWVFYSEIKQLCRYNYGLNRKSALPYHV